MAKVKAKIIGVTEAEENLRILLNKTIKESEILNEIGSTSKDQIKKQTRARLDEYKQPDIKETTIERRKTLIKQGNTSEFTNAKRSNLTLSGQLLDSIVYKIAESTASITLFLKNNRKPYKGKKGQDLENKTNTEIMQDLKARGFDFLFISDRLKSQLQSKVKAYIRRKLSNYKSIKRSLK